MIPDDITYLKLSSLLLDSAVGVGSPVDDQIRGWTDDGPHMLYGLFSAKVLPELLGAEEKNVEVLRRIFDLFELMANHRDEDVRGVIGLSVCQELASNEMLLQKSQRYMGKATKKFCADIAS